MKKKKLDLKSKKSKPKKLREEFGRRARRLCLADGRINPAEAEFLMHRVHALEEMVDVLRVGLMREKDRHCLSSLRWIEDEYI